MPDDNKIQIAIHDAKPYVWNSNTTIGMNFNNPQSEMSIYLSAEEAIKAGEKLYQYGKRVQKIQQLQKMEVVVSNPPEEESV